MTLAWLKPHIFYVVLIAVGVLGAYSFLKEHDARLLAEAKVEAAQTQIKSIQAQAAAQVQQVRTIVVQAKTPVQQVAAIPQLSDVPLNARLAPQLEAQPPAVTVDLAPLLSELQTCKTCTIQLAECQQISAQKDEQIKALKQKPKFWSRVVSTAKILAIGAGIGIAIGGHL